MACPAPPRYGEPIIPRRARTHPLWLALAAALALACDEANPPDIDPFPIRVNTENGPLMTGAVIAGGAGGETGDAFPVLVDTLTPLTVVDSFRPPGELPAPSRRRTDVTLLSACPGTDPSVGCSRDQPAVARARYLGASVLDLHPCQDPNADCRVGLGNRTATYRGIIGGDLLGRTAVRLDLRSPLRPVISLLPDIAGQTADHCRAGRAVIPTPLSGGSTILIEGGEVTYGASRIPIDVCLQFDPDAPGDPTGTDLLLLMTTGLGPSVIGESAYERYRRDQERECAADPLCTDPPPLPYTELPRQELQLPSGRSAAGVFSVARLALVGDVSDQRGPCEERRTAQIMSTMVGCGPDLASCPCADGLLSCRSPAAVHLEPLEAIQIAVLPDAHPMLQALREELRPGQAEVDGLLGVSALAFARIDIDYPSARLLIDCTDDLVIGVEHPPCVRYTQVQNETEATPDAKCPAPQ